MLSTTHDVAGQPAEIRVVETQQDVETLLDWLDTVDYPVAADTETTGLDVFKPGFRVRTVQIGDSNLAWVVPVEEVGLTKQQVARMFDRRVLFHNAAYDLAAIQRFFGHTIEWDQVRDTRIYAHLLDTRPAKEGGVGHSLQELTRRFIGEDVADEIKGSMKEMAKAEGLTVGEVFEKVPTFNEDYLLYAGMDVILTHRLFLILSERLRAMKKAIPRFNTGLIEYEHRVARVCYEVGMNGFRVDTRYTSKLGEKLEEEAEVWEALALLEYGVESVSSADDVAQAALEAGYKLTEKTATGKYKMNQEVLEDLSEQGFTLADYVIAAKSAVKRKKSWVDKFLEVDDNNRIHASINTLAARTARMSITGIPAQTLPSSGWEIRRCFIPEDGNVIVSCDYQAQELRVLAALSGDKNMREAFASNADLHQLTADASGVARKVGKTVNFAYVYGSGAGNIARTCGITVSKAREVIDGFERTYPGVKKLSDRLQREAKKGFIVTPVGRVLRTDPDRPYAALNYMIQSTSRDITASALLRLDKEGFTPCIRLPIHDEVLAEVPEDKAAQFAERIADLMAADLQGVHIGSDHDILGYSWGGGYVDEDDYGDVAAYQATFE